MNGSSIANVAVFVFLAADVWEGREVERCPTNPFMYTRYSSSIRVVGQNMLLILTPLALQRSFLDKLLEISIG